MTSAQTRNTSKASANRSESGARGRWPPRRHPVGARRLSPHARKPVRITLFLLARHNRSRLASPRVSGSCVIVAPASQRRHSRHVPIIEFGGKAHRRSLEEIRIHEATARRCLACSSGRSRIHRYYLHSRSPGFLRLSLRSQSPLPPHSRSPLTPSTADSKLLRGRITPLFSLLGT